ncbi:MAG TPA: hypothetical protein VIQ11_17045, partial [Mycobacterium sp.]
MDADEDTGDERYRLDVMVGSVTEAVSCAGGWLFDRAFNGWDVTVFVAACPGDVRPLHVLGAKAVDLEAALSGPERRPAALSVSAELYAANERVRRVVRNALRRRAAEITVWGGRRPPELRRRIEPVHHQLSTAACTYKLHALGAAGVHVNVVDGVETLGRAQRNP